MPSERTPLVQSVPVAEHRDRYPHTRVKRYCTFALTAIPALVVIVGLIYIAATGRHDFLGEALDTTSNHAPTFALPHAAWPESEGISYEKLKDFLLTTPSGDKAREWSKYYSAGPHLAGKNLSQAEWTKDRWEEFGVHHAEVVAYEVYLNYPLDHGLALLEDGKVKFRATLEEDILDEDPTTSLPDRIPTFHGYSASGNVTAPFVFCNYGSYRDYEELVEAGVDLKGKIALVKYGGNFRGLKVKRASELGMIGVVMYSDPGDDGEVTEEKGLKPYPDGPARHPSSVQRGSCQYLSIAPGDPTTVGYPSKPGVPRQSVEGKIPDIPSLPISYAEALPLLKALNGHGPNASAFSENWQTGGLGYKGVDYNIGPSPDSVEVNLFNLQEYVTTPLWNTIGVINGTIDDEVVVLGNHRDAWVAGGAGDPNSGSAVLNEIVRSFGEAVKAGWKPQRTIVFASWDGEEYGLLGSTEWVEEYIPWLSSSSVAYINLDVAANGAEFGAAAAPVLNQALFEVTSQVLSPNQTVAGQTVRDVWNGEISTMGSGSDFTAFQDFAGIPSIDLGFVGGPNSPIYHYHSNYDSFHWMDTLGDPGFEYHITMAKVAGLLAAKLMEEPVIQFNATDYAFELEKYLDSVLENAESQHMEAAAYANPLNKIYAAVEKFQNASVSFDAKAASLVAGLSTLDSLPLSASSQHSKAVQEVNQKYKALERQFLYSKGLDGRNWFKHVVFAPGIWTGYAGATFPGLVEAMDDKNSSSIARWTEIIIECIDNATDLLLE